MNATIYNMKALDTEDYPLWGTKGTRPRRDVHIQ